MRVASLLTSLVLVTAATLVHADTLSSFTLNLPNTLLSYPNGTSYGSVTLDGSATIDTTTGSVTSAGVFGESGNLYFNATTITYQGTSNPNSPPPPHNGGGGGCNDGCVFLQPYGTYYVALSDPTTSAAFTLSFATNSLIGYTGGTICAGGCPVSGKATEVYDQAGDGTRVTVKGTTSSSSAVLNSPPPPAPDPTPGPIAIDPIPGPAPFNPPLPPTPDPTAGPMPGPTPAAVTPEPSTLCLFGTGLLGLAGTLRRRLRA